MIPKYIVLAGVYDLFIYKLTNVIYNDLSFADRTQKTYQLLLILSILGIVIPKMIINIPNQTLRDGIVHGSYIILISTVLLYWNQISDDWKLFLLGMVMAYLVWYKSK